MNKSIILPIVFALAITGLSSQVFVVHAEEGAATVPNVAGSNVPEGEPAVGGSNAPEAPSIIPDNTGTGANESGPIVPSTGGTGSNESSAIIPNTGGSNTDEGTLPAGTNNGNGGGNTTSNGGSSVSTGGGSSVGSGGSVPTILPVATVTFTGTGAAPSACPLLTGYLKLGGNNNPTEVTKLQAFLRNVEKLDVDVNGTFDQKTQNAVIAFQTKYASSILGPWEASQPSGFVYITTVKTINRIACMTNFSLNTDEQSIIDAYKARRNQPSTTTVEIGQENVNTPANTGTSEIGSNAEQNNENVAAVSESSVTSRFWNFIKGLFR